MRGKSRSLVRGVAARSLALLCLGLSQLGCDQGEPSAPGPAAAGGSTGGATTGGGAGASAAELALPLPLYHLTNREYDQSVRDLLQLDATQLTSAPSSGFPVDGSVEKYAVGDTVSALWVERAESAAERLAAMAIEHPERLLPCDPASAGEDACAASFIAEFG